MEIIKNMKYIKKMNFVWDGEWRIRFKGDQDGVQWDISVSLNNMLNWEDIESNCRSFDDALDFVMAEAKMNVKRLANLENKN